MAKNLILIFLQLLFLVPLHGEAQKQTKKSEVSNATTSELYDLPENVSESPEANSNYTQYDENYFWGELVNMLITLGCIVVLLAALMWIMKRMQTSRVRYANEASIIKVIDQRALSPKTSIYLLQINQKAIVVADTQSGATRLAEFSMSELGNISSKPIEKSQFRTLFDRKQAE